MAERPVSVLLVEDDDDDYLLAKELFDELPPGMYHLDRVADYATALQTLESCQHDIYLVDYRLGEHNGLELMAEAIRRGCTAPMIMLTGQVEREIDLQAMMAGAVDYLIKDSLDAATLERSMRYALAHRRHAEAIRRTNQQLEQRVQERTAELARVNETLRSEIAERKRAEEALRQADRRKDEFLAMLAHELRNPLAAMSNAMTLLELDPGEGQLPQLRELIRRQVEQLIRLIDDLLDVSRISRGKLTLRREVVPLKDVIDAALDVARPSIETSRHRLEASLPDEPLTVEGDKVRLAQIISNLLVNAARYTPAGGQIELAVWREGGQVAIRVRDNGIGIPPDMLPRIFELFTQVDSSPTRSQQGLGIGLTLVKTLVEMHGGRVSAASEGPGRGSEFLVHLPLARTAVVSLSHSDEQPAHDAGLAAFRILIVDDNESAAYLLGRLLQKLGQQVHTAYGASAALANLQHVRPDVVFSDIAMPGISGYELAQQIRSRPELHQPILVALTGYGQESDRQQALEAGFDHHLTKPAGLPALIELLAQLPAPEATASKSDRRL